MNKSIKISIIIPIYNVETYLLRCLDSIEKQSYRNLQVILVNDGSTDSSREIASSFVEKDSRFQILDQDNQGLSAARNAGLPFAIGDFVFYLDSDDYLDAYCIEELVMKAVRYEADVVQTNFYYHYGDHLLFDESITDDIIIDNPSRLMSELLNQKIIKNFAWGKLIKTSIAKRHLFPVGKYFEDTYWMYHIVYDSAKYVISKNLSLFYIQRDASISGKFSLRNLDQIEGEVKRLEFVRNKYPKSLFNKARYLFLEKILLHKHMILLSHIKDVNEYREKLDVYYRQVVNEANFWQRLRYQYSFINKGYFLYKRAMNRVFVKNTWKKIKCHD